MTSLNGTRPLIAASVEGLHRQTQDAADAIGRPVLLIDDGGRYVLRELRLYKARPDGRGTAWLPTILWAAWPGRRVR